MLQFWKFDRRDRVLKLTGRVSTAQTSTNKCLTSTTERLTPATECQRRLSTYPISTARMSTTKFLMLTVDRPNIDSFHVDYQMYNVDSRPAEHQQRCHVHGWFLKVLFLFTSNSAAFTKQFVLFFISQCLCKCCIFRPVYRASAPKTQRKSQQVSN